MSRLRPLLTDLGSDDSEVECLWSQFVCELLQDGWDANAMNKLTMLHVLRGDCLVPTMLYVYSAVCLLCCCVCAYIFH